MAGLAIALFVIGLLVSIMIHEWGHFASARKFGMRADRFFVGFGPTLWSTRRGETEYGVKALPLGGFVRIRGMAETDQRRPPVPDEVFDPETVAAERRTDAEGRGVDVLEVPAITDATWARLEAVLEERGTPSDLRHTIVEHARARTDQHATTAEARVVLQEILEEHVTDTGGTGDLHHRLLQGDKGRFFHDRPGWQRAIVLSAGSALHFTQAIVLLFLLFWLAGLPDFVPVVERIQPDSPAEAAGLQPGDRLLAIDGINVDDFESAQQLIQDRAGRPTTFLVERDDATFRVTAAPEPTENEDGNVVGVLGFNPAVENQPMGFFEAIGRTFVGEGSVTDLTGRTFQVMGDVFGPQGIGRLFSQVSGEEARDSGGAASLVGAGRIAAEGATDFGLFLTVGSLLVSINIFIGIFNILPLPPLDGGHLAVLGVEQSVNAARRARGKAADFQVDPRAVAAVAIPVIVLIGMVSIALLWLDLVNPITLR